MRNVGQTEERLLIAALQYAKPDRLDASEVKNDRAALLSAALDFAKAKTWARNKRDAWKKKKRLST